MTASAATDEEAWLLYPELRRFFDKLWLSARLGYACGPGGVAVPAAASYIVRPIVNLRGLGIGASFEDLGPGLRGAERVPPGSFWCERFLGEQTSHELTWQDDAWRQTSAWQGEPADQPGRFRSWRRSSVTLRLPPMLGTLSVCGRINVEAVAGRVIEVHLRPSPDPVGFDEFIPIMATDSPEMMATHVEAGFVFCASELRDPFAGHRLGFLCR